MTPWRRVDRAVKRGLKTDLNPAIKPFGGTNRYHLWTCDNDLLLGTQPLIDFSISLYISSASEEGFLIVAVPSPSSNFTLPVTFS